MLHTDPNYTGVSSVSQEGHLTASERTAAWELERLPLGCPSRGTGGCLVW